MVSFRGQKKLGPRPDRSPLGALIQNFRRASPPHSYTESSPGVIPNESREHVIATLYTITNVNQQVLIKGVFPLHSGTVKYHTLTFSHSRFHLIFYSSLDTTRRQG